MRVSIIHPHLFVRGGGERLTKILVAGLRMRGVEVSITTSLLRGGFLEAELAGNVFLFRNPPVPLRSVTLRSLAEVALSINETLTRFDPDVVVAMTEDTMNLGMSKLLKRGLKAIQYVHFPIEEESCYSNLYRSYHRFPVWLNRAFLWAPDFILCNSKYTMSAIGRAWKRSAHVVYPAIDYPFMRPLENLGEPRENLILCVGRFTKLKRQDFLVRVFSKVKRRVEDARLILAGYPDGRHIGFLKNLQNPGEKDVEIILNPSDQVLIQLYSRAKVYAHPRIAEHFGLTPLEAMSQGAPVVAYGRGGIKETVLNEKTGYLAQNDEEFTRYLVKVLEMRHSEWVRLQQEAVARARIFSPETFIEGFMKFIKPSPAHRLTHLTMSVCAEGMNGSWSPFRVYPSGCGAEVDSQLLPEPSRLQAA
ncbi:MAG: glycosyltransferase family 4 protein [Candidatus Bathyarchaeia archaeon]